MTHHRINWLIGCTLALSIDPCHGQTAPATFDLKAEAEAQARFETVPDTRGSGKFPSLKEEDSSLPGHVVYRPSDLGSLGALKLGVVLWGNGGCSADGASSRLHLEEIASHGYLAIANGKILTGPGSPPYSGSSAPAGGHGHMGDADFVPPPPATQSADLIAGLNWALHENEREGSQYFHRINPAWVAVAGWSCGGLQALEVALDPRIHTALIHSSGIFMTGNPLPGLQIRKSDLAKLHTPIIYILGGPADIAYRNGMDDFHHIEHVPAFVVNLEVGHGGTFREANGGREASIAVSWLDWQLKGDRQSAPWFVGPDCGLCLDPNVTFARNKLAFNAK